MHSLRFVYKENYIADRVDARIVLQRLRKCYLKKIFIYLLKNNYTKIIINII